MYVYICLYLRLFVAARPFEIFSISLTNRLFRKPPKIIWFKNWAKLKSIHSMEHFHVMMKDPDMDFIKEITNGDEPASSRLAEGEILE